MHVLKPALQHGKLCSTAVCFEISFATEMHVLKLLKTINGKALPHDQCQQWHRLHLQHSIEDLREGPVWFILAVCGLPIGRQEMFQEHIWILGGSGIRGRVRSQHLRRTSQDIFWGDHLQPPSYTYTYTYTYTYKYM